MGALKWLARRVLRRELGLLEEQVLRERLGNERLEAMWRQTRDRVDTIDHEEVIWACTVAVEHMQVEYDSTVRYAVASLREANYAGWQRAKNALKEAQKLPPRGRWWL